MRRRPLRESARRRPAAATRTSSTTCGLRSASPSPRATPTNVAFARRERDATTRSSRQHRAHRESGRGRREVLQGVAADDFQRAIDRLVIRLAHLGDHEPGERPVDCRSRTCSASGTRAPRKGRDRRIELRDAVRHEVVGRPPVPHARGADGDRRNQRARLAGRTPMRSPTCEQEEVRRAPW